MDSSHPIYFSPFINYLKITLKSSTQIKIKPFYCTKFVIALVKGFLLLRDMPKCTAEFSKKFLVVDFSNISFFHSKKTKKKYQKSKENMPLKTYF